MFAQVYAVYDRNRRLLVILALLCLAEGGTTLLIEALTQPRGEDNHSPCRPDLSV